MPPDDVLEALCRGPWGHGFALVLGALLGSFANVCILRIPKGQSIARPGSHCFACGKPVRWYDNLPILSYFVLGGKCRDCGARFSARYLFVELATAALVLGVFRLALFELAPWEPLPHRLARFAVYALFALVLVVITFIDLDHKKIPDRITYPGIPLFFALAFALGDRPWWDRAIGVAVGYGIVRAISDGYYLLTKREGMGYGDGKLLALIGALLGWRAVVFSLFGGAVLGSVIGISILVVHRRRAAAAPAPPPGAAGDADAEPSLRHVEIPFGPYLVAAALVHLFLQDTIRMAFSRFIFPGF